MKHIGLIDNGLDEHQKKFIEDKRKEYEVGVPSFKNAEPDEDSSYPPSSTLCMKCSTKAVVLMDGCMTCLSCGDSKCG
jgi:hypothetical protein